LPIIAYRQPPTGGGPFKFVMATSTIAGTGPCSDATLFSFAQLNGADGSALTAQPLNVETMLDIPAHPSLASCGGVKSSTMPWLMMDPANDNRGHLIFQDCSVLGGNEFRVYGYILDRVYTETINYWTISARRIIAPPSDVGTDQFLPSATIDDLGRVHVIYYENAGWSGCGISTGLNDYDCYYCLLDSSGNLLFKSNLRGCAQSVALDFDSVATASCWSPREYNGIQTRRVNGTQIEAWMTYAGTSSEGPGRHPSLIYANRIIVTD